MSPDNALHSDGPRVARPAGERGRYAAEMNKRAVLIVTCALVSSCALTPESFPGLDASKLTDAVAVVRFGNGVYLQQFPGCEDENVICLDPPPFRLQAEVVEQVFGPPLPRTISFVSTSHFGIPRTRPDALQMIHLISDGAVHVMPRYHRAEVGEDARGELVIPAFPDEIWWLPCGINTMKAEVTFRFPRNRFAEPAEDIDQKLLANHPDFYVLGGKNIRPRYGVRIDDLAEFLKECQPAGSDAFVCNDE
jgi:hypothetical protein